jgi:UDP-3-O-[3-hydroxymyristoyl] N-acetylglucosamine deacetylase
VPVQDQERRQVARSAAHIVREGARAVRVHGFGLFSGEPVNVLFAYAPGALAFIHRGVRVELGSLAPNAGLRSSALPFSPEVSVQTVEHLAAALAGAHVYRDLEITFEGVEAPLLDGGAKVFSQAIASLALGPQASLLEVVCNMQYDLCGSVYRFAPPPQGAPTAGARGSVRVVFRTEDPRLAADAAWCGDRKYFFETIAPARTFAFVRDLDAYHAQGVRSHVEPESVVLIGDSIASSGARFLGCEPARHKLLDLIGDLYLHGGPPRGEVFAIAPGHAKTHEAMRRAFADGVVRHV